MLTDIFAKRYESKIVADRLPDQARNQLCVQMFRIISEQVCPYYLNGHESARGKQFWADVQAELSMELGLVALTEKSHPSSTWHDVCEKWMLRPNGSRIDLGSTDLYLKHRISLVELCFRKRQQQLKQESIELPIKAAEMLRTARSNATYLNSLAVQVHNDAKSLFQQATDELNTRFQQFGLTLHYHNGYIQFSDDEMLLKQIEQPFWNLLSENKWKNVDIDFKEAIDRRDNLERDPVFYAMKALESCIKIVSDENGVTHGRETGAISYIENLASVRGNHWLKKWEAEQLRSLFTNVRNPVGHGPGNSPMPNLNTKETNLILDLAMTWIKCLVTRS